MAASGRKLARFRLMAPMTTAGFYNIFRDESTEQLAAISQHIVGAGLVHVASHSARARLTGRSIDMPPHFAAFSFAHTRDYFDTQQAYVYYGHYCRPFSDTDFRPSCSMPNFAFGQFRQE